MIKAILVDDEIHCLDTLSILVKEYCPEIEIIKQCNSAKAALSMIQNHQPGLVFLDIEMPVMNGFELLEQFKEITFSVIFTTSYDQYAIKAIRFSALDYLLKPIDPKELMIAVHKAATLKNPPSTEQLKMLMDQIHNRENRFTKIAIPTSDGFEMIPAEIVIRCEADDNYTHFYLSDKRRITVCRTLKEVEEQLEDFGYFIRVHHSYLVNLNQIAKYIRGEGGYLIMSDGNTVNVSRSRKEFLLKKVLPEKE